MRMLLLGLIFALPTFSVAEEKRVYWKDTQSTDDLMCLAMNIYHEARGEPEHGMFAVGLVTMNRVASNRYPDTTCGVVWQTKRNPKTGKRVPQFSWTLDGRSDEIKDSESWLESVAMARIVFSLEAKDNTGITHYHADYVNPWWSERLTKVATVGRHIFYR